MHGTREWTDYQVSTAITPHLAVAAGIGERPGYAALLRAAVRDGKARLVKALDGIVVQAEPGLARELRQT